jgi:uncharacterized protein
VANANGELDYEGAVESAPYTGQGGIPIENIFRRALFAWDFRDINLLLSNQITDQSRLMIYRDIEERASKAVPFLSFDADPYFAIVDGQPVWILDAYTGSNGYPYSQSVNASAATDGLFFGQYNYIRNSVKVVVNAYDGTVTYWADLSEPVAQVWNNAYPGLFQNIADAPPALQAHFRYPENLFQIQAYQFANYHVSDPTTFYQRRDFWQVSPDPTQTASTVSGSLPPMRPYYQLIKVPGADTEQFQLVIPFVPAGRQNMVAWMAASSDPVDYGHVTMFRFPEGRNIEGPQQVFARINNDPSFSSLRTLLSQQGSQLYFGDFLVIPIDNSFLYVLPVYVQSSEGAQIPELKRVIVVNGSGGDVSIGATLPEALAQATGGVTGGGPGNGGPNGGPGNGGQGTTDQQIQALLAEALSHFAAAQTALRTGDLALYQQELAKAQELVQQANDLAASQAGSTTSPTPSPGVTPSPSAAVSASPSPSG